MEAAPINTKEIVSTLLDGLTVSSRKDGTVHTVKVEKKTVAEVCVGARIVRLNFKVAPPKGKVPKSVKLATSKSKSWPGGGVVVTAENAAAARAVLSAVAA